MGTVIALDTFSGSGNATNGLRWAGYTVLGYELWEQAISTHRANGLACSHADLKVKSLTNWRGKVQLLWGSPPCQPFSQAGKQGGVKDKRDCVPDWLRLVGEVMAPTIIMENVQGLGFVKHAWYMKEVVERLQALGYTVEYRVLNAAHYGQAQARKRLYLIGRLDGTPTWPTQSPGIIMADRLGWGTDEAARRAIVPSDGEAEAWVYQRPSMTVVGSFRPEVMAAPGYRKAGDPPRQRTPGSVILTLDEAAALQEFPEGYKFCGSVGDQWLQVGNAVISNMAEMLARVNQP